MTARVGHHCEGERFWRGQSWGELVVRCLHRMKRLVRLERASACSYASISLEAASFTSLQYFCQSVRSSIFCTSDADTEPAGFSEPTVRFRHPALGEIGRLLFIGRSLIRDVRLFHHDLSLE